MIMTNHAFVFCLWKTSYLKNRFYPVQKYFDKRLETYEQILIGTVMYALKMEGPDKDHFRKIVEDGFEFLEKLFKTTLKGLKNSNNKNFRSLLRRCKCQTAVNLLSIATHY